MRWASGEIFGYSAENLIGQSVRMLMPKETAAEHDGYLARYIRTGSARILATVREVEGRRADGSLFPMSLSVRECRVGRQLLFVGVIRDLTQERQLRARLLQAEKLESIGQLAAGIAHEINTPTQFVGDNLAFLATSLGEITELIQTLEGSLAALRASGVVDESLDTAQRAIEGADLEFLMKELPESVSQSQEGVARIAQIVKAMKAFSHPGGASRTPIDLNDAVQCAATVCRSEWKELAQLEFDLDLDLPPIACHASELNQAVLNLIVNAAHAVGDARGRDPSQGRICVGTKHMGDNVQIRVTDNGGGIPEHIRERIFDPFFTTKSVGRGTGQGLAVAYNVIQRHEGRIWFDTEIGTGTTFYLEIPLVDDEAKATEA